MAQAENNPTTGFIQVPVKWCVIGEDLNDNGQFDPGERGVPAFTNPGGVGEPDTDTLLWHRHERASDRIWKPGANITFRSGFTAAIKNNANFPIIPDPEPPLPDVGQPDPTVNYGPGEYGDIQVGTLEVGSARLSCRSAWDEIDPNLEGITAINLGHFVNEEGEVDDTVGLGLVDGNYINEQVRCELPTPVENYNPYLEAEGSVWVVDSSFIQDPDERTLAHELGHALFLAHGNGEDDEPDGRFDEECDPDEFEFADPETLMTQSGISDSKDISQLQRITARAVARVHVGAQVDPPSVLIPGDVIGDSIFDQIQEVSDDSVDLTSLKVVENTVAETTFFSHELLGLISLPNHQFLVFADLDNDPATGGEPSTLGFPTNFQGAELVTRVQVTQPVPILPENSSASNILPFSTIGTVWRFEAGAFQIVNDPEIRAEVNRVTESETGQPLYDVVSIRMPNSVRGATTVPLRIQALAESANGELDRLPDEPIDGNNGNNLISLIPPEFPVCRVTPDSVPAGRIATVEASDLIPNRTAKVFLGDRMIATPQIDGEGNVDTNVIIPSNAREGSRLVTVGVMGTALTADCEVNVTAPKLSRYEYTPKLVCGIQKDPMNMQLAKGFYGTTINIHNPGLSTVQFDKKLALTIPPGNQQPGKVLPIARDELSPDEALAVDCDRIRQEVFDDEFPASFIEGFVDLESPKSLDVTAVYTTADLGFWNKAKNHSSIDVEQIRERRNNEKFPDLIVSSIDGLDVNCQGGAGTCVSVVKATISNIGVVDADSFKVRVILDPEQSVTVDRIFPEGLAAGDSETFTVTTPQGGNCFDPDCTICITVDNEDDILESDEANNKVCITNPG